MSANPLLQIPSAGPTFTYQVGTGTPASRQTIQVTSSSTPLPFTVTAAPVGWTTELPDGIARIRHHAAGNHAVHRSLNTSRAAPRSSPRRESVTVSSPGAAAIPAETFTAHWWAEQ